MAQDLDLEFLDQLASEPLDTDFLDSLATEPPDDSAPDPFGFAEEMLALADENETVQADAEYRQKVDDAMYGQQSLVSRMGGQFKQGVESNLDNVFDTVSGGAWEARRDEAYGNTEADRDAARAEANARINATVARNSYIPGGELLAEGAQSAGGMTPALIGGAAFRTPALGAAPYKTLNSTTATAALMGASYAPDDFKEARRAGKNVLESTAYAALQMFWEVGSEVVGGKVAKAFGGRTFEQIFDSQPVKSVLGYVVGTAADAGGEAATEVLQGITSAVSGVNPDAMQGLGDRALRAATIGGILAGSSNAIPTVAEFIQNPSRSNARKAGIPPEAANSTQQREEIAKFASDALTADDFKKQMRALAEDGGPITATQADYLIQLTEARATAAGETLGDYVGKRIKGIERGTWQGSKDALEQADPTLDAKRPSGAIQFLADDGRAVIHAFEQANFATMVHEMGHLFRRDLTDTDLRTAERWAGVGKSGGKWSRFAEERFARAFEQYSRDGKHPNPGLRKVFKKFRKWMTEIYSTIKGTPLDVNIPSEMRSVYDNLFTKEAQTKYGPQNRPRDPNAQIPDEAYYPDRDPRLTQQRVPTAAPPQPVAPTTAPAAPQQQAQPVLEQPAPQAAVPPQAAPVPAEAPPAEPPTTTPNDFPTESRPPNTYSPRHAWVREDVKEVLGTDITPQLPESWEQNKAEAIEQGVPEIALELSNEIIAAPRPLKDSEQAGIMLRYVDSMKRFKQLESQIKNADPKKQKHLVAAREQLHGELLAMAVALDYGGSELGRALNLRKMILDQDGDLFTNLAKAQATKGTDLTRTEQAKVEAKVNKRDRLKKSVEKQEALAKKKQHREIARLKSAVSNIRQIVGLDPQKLGNVDVPGLTAEEQATVDGLRKKLDEAEKQLAAMENLPVLDRVNNRPSEKIISELDDAVAKVRSMIAAKKPKAPRPEPTSAEIENRRIKSLEKQLATIEEQIASPEKVQQFNFDVASKRRTELKAEISAARKRLREKQPPPSSLIEDRKIVALEKALAKTQQDLANAKKGLLPTGKPKPMDAASERRTFLNTQLKKARRELAETIQSLKPFEWWDIVTMSSDFLRNIKGGVDFSAIRRQGALVAGRPAVLAKAASAGVKGAKSDYDFEKHYRSIMDRPNAADYERTSLAVQDMDTPVGQKDEFMNSFLVSKIPFIKGSQRAYIAAINEMRADMYDILKEKMGGDAGLTWEQKKSIAHTVNVLTGRGDWKRLDQSMHTLSTFFWSPRLYLSRVQFLTGQPIWNAEPGTRKIVATEMGRSIAGVLSVYSLYIAAAAMREYARNDEVEWDYITDPRHPAFGKIRIGDTYIDPTGGISQFVRFASQMWTGEQVDDKGKVTELSGYQKRQKITSMLQSKLAPLTGLALDMAVGENYIGDPMNLTSFEGAVNVLTGVVLPLSLNGPIKYAIGAGFPEEWQSDLGEDIRIQLEQLGVPETIILNLLGVAGEGVTTYKKKKK